MLSPLRWIFTKTAKCKFKPVYNVKATYNIAGNAKIVTLKSVANFFVGKWP